MTSSASRPDSEPVRAALRSMVATHTARAGRAPAELRPATHGGQSGSVLATVLVASVAAVVAVVLATTGAGAAGCPTITYAARGSPPSYLFTEMRAAAREIHERTGITFEHGSRGVARLAIIWSLSEIGPAHRRSEGAGREVGWGEGTWTVSGSASNLAFEHGAIEIDGARQWHLGWDRGDSLRAVLLHELGHVVGLGHSEVPSSVMHATTAADPRAWTADDISRLAEIGRRAGCSPGESGATPTAAAPQTA